MGNTPSRALVLCLVVSPWIAGCSGRASPGAEASRASSDGGGRDGAPIDAGAPGSTANEAGPPAPLAPDAALTPSPATCGGGRTLSRFDAGPPTVLAGGQFSPSRVFTSGSDVYFQTTSQSASAPGGCSLVPGACGGGQHSQLVRVVPPVGAQVIVNLPEAADDYVASANAIFAGYAGGVRRWAVTNGSLDVTYDQPSWSVASSAIGATSSSLFMLWTDTRCAERWVWTPGSAALQGFPSLQLSQALVCTPVEPRRVSIVQTDVQGFGGGALLRLVDVAGADDIAASDTAVFWSLAGTIRGASAGAGALMVTPTITVDPYPGALGSLDGSLPDASGVRDAGRVDAAASGRGADAGADGGAAASGHGADAGADGGAAREPGLQSAREIASSLPPTIVLAVRGGFVYFAANDTLAPGKGVVGRIPEAGGAVQKLVAGVSPAALAVDDANVYFIDGGSSCSAIRRVPVGGGPVQTVAEDQPSATSIALTATGVVWTNTLGGTVSDIWHGETAPRGSVMRASK